jgi:2-polyprenyl-3-methyl-5-hydroxy-6-metoxy-1,4-benzoquinol methylase
VALPAPLGPHGVGSVTCRLNDLTRPSHLASQGSGRSLLIKVWYPADPSGNSATELVWDQLRTDRRTPTPMRWLLKGLRTRTASRPRAQIRPGLSASSVVIYNHGLISFASENTTLMEHLASHCQIVVAIQHLEQLPELQTLNRSQSPSETRKNQQLTRRLREATPDERAQLAVEYYESAPTTNRIVVERAVDTVFVLDHLSEVLANIPGIGSGHAATCPVHLVGFSVGGAVSTETAKRDSRAGKVVNLDGGWHGSTSRAEIAMPYLMMYSSASEGMNDAFLPRQTRSVAPPGTRHLNYHDVAGLMPSLRYFGALGPTDATAFLAYRNKVVHEFIAQDDSNGWEAVAGKLIVHRERSRIGVATVRAWAQHLPKGASILDLGCGSGVPISEALLNDGFAVDGIDASPTLVAAFQQRFPHAAVACERAETSRMFGRAYDGILAVGLMFLLAEEAQRSLILRAGAALKPGGRFLFSSPAQACTWLDLMTGRESRSLGAAAYAAILSEARLTLVAEYRDEGESDYYDAVKSP